MGRLSGAASYGAPRYQQDAAVLSPDRVSNIARVSSEVDSGMTGRQSNREAAAQAAIGPRLRHHRQRRGISLRKLAAQADISPSALSQIELGRSLPTVGTLYAIVGALDVSFNQLLSDGEEGGSGPEGAGPGGAG